jgi:hypothetical protein
MFLIYTLICIYAALFITSPVITIFHELGHAIAYLVLTKPDKIDVFIGSYGNTNTKFNFKVGKLHFYIKQSFPFTMGGLCRSHKEENNYLNKIIILLAGPFFSFIVACLIGIIIFNTDIHGAVKLFCFALIICSFISLFSNLKPKIIKRGTLENDGKQLQFTWKIRNVFSEYVSANRALLKCEYDVANEAFSKLIVEFPNEVNFLRPFILSLLHVKNFDEARKHLLILEENNDLITIDYLNWGYLQSILEEHDLAIVNYRKALNIEEENLYGLNNLGYELILKGENREARELLEKAIKIDPLFAHSYNNLGYLMITLGDLNNGKQNIEKSLELEPNNAYAFKHLGIYYLKLLDKRNAVANFEKALELDSSIKIEQFVKETELL